MLYSVLCLLCFLFEFSYHLDWEESAGGFTLTVFLMSFDCYCSNAYPQDALGWYADY